MDKLNMIQTGSVCFDLRKADEKEQEGLMEHEVAVIAVNHENEAVYMVVSKNDLRKLLE